MCRCVPGSDCLRISVSLSLFFSPLQLYSMYRGVLGPRCSADSGFICRGPLKHIVVVPRGSHLPHRVAGFTLLQTDVQWGARVSMNGAWLYGMSFGGGLQVAKRSWRSAESEGNGKRQTLPPAVPAEHIRVFMLSCYAI